MDIAWNEFKPILRRAYFGEWEDSVAPRESSSANDFWKFFQKYLTVATRKGLTADRRSKEEKSLSLNELGVPEKYYDKSAKIVTDEFRLSKTAKYSLREVPGYVIKEFEYVLSCWLAFCQKEKLAKLKKLRRAQRNLPIWHYRDEIVSTLEKSNVLVVAGDTGCGKSTQVPQYLLEAGYDQIACTQPRRIACISLAKRVSFETLQEYGSKIAYQIRFEKTKTGRTKMLFLTEGLLLRQLNSDGQLSMYKVIILDEIHERHLHGDFLMGMLRELVKIRTDLKLILMSATINLELFSNYFHGAPVIQVPGRLYPIELKYFPTDKPLIQSTDDKKRVSQSTGSDKIDPAPYRRILHLIDTKYPANERGDVLMFLSGITEMTTVAEALKIYAEQTRKWIIMMLHSTLSLEEQDKVFDIAPEGVKKCILSTNIAETSVTIDGVRFVIDSGKVKEMRYDSTTRMHQLKEIAVSQASAEQRKGRAGRTGPGVCYRLYSATEYEMLEKYSTSEIRRVSLESLVLQMYHLGLSGPRGFEFIEPPESTSLDEAVECLKDQGALRSVLGGKWDELTSLGRILVRLPVDVAVGKMLVMGCLFKQVEAVLTVAAGISVQSPFTNRSYRDYECMTLRKNLVSDHGDPFTLLNTYREWLEVKNEGSESTRRWAKMRGIEEQRLYEITKLRQQFKDLLEDADLIEKSSLAEQATGSAERRIRKGEMKRLHDLKRKFQHEQRKRKVLKADQHYDSLASMMEVESEDNPDAPSSSKRQDTDVHALEFQMRHKAADLVEAVREHKLNHSMATMIKIIFSSALYPQYGLLDQHNSYKVGTDQMVHTKTKPFVILHPTSCLGEEPEVLQITTDMEGRSENHQAIVYGLLLETTKPYVVNSVRVPALHTLLLLARQVETSRDFTRIVCDNFAEFLLVDGNSGEELVSEAIEIRKLFARCLERKIEGEPYRSDRLGKKLMKFTMKQVVYGIKRIIQTKQEKSQHFVSPTLDALGPLAVRKMEENRDREMDNDESIPVIDSDSIGDFLRVGTVPGLSESVGISSSEFVATKWRCPNCGEDYYSSSVEKLAHVQSCNKEEEDVIEPDLEEEEDNNLTETSHEMTNMETSSEAKEKDKNPLKKIYHCENCSKNLRLTPVEILKHKKSHLASKN